MSRSSSTRRSSWAGLGLAVSVAVAGCKAGSPPQAKADLAGVGTAAKPEQVEPPANSQAYRPRVTERPAYEADATPAADDETRQLLAAKSESYTKAVAAAVERRAAKQPPTPPAPAPQPDEVNFAAPSAPPPPVAPAAAPATPPMAESLAAGPVTKSIASSASATAVDAVQANQVASVARAVGDDPMIVPEGDEVGEPVRKPAAAQVPIEPERVRDVLDRRLKDNPRDVVTHVDYQLYQLIAGQSAPVLAALTPLPSEDREIVAAVVDGLSNFRDAQRADPNALLSRKVRPLVDMADRLRSSASLAIPTLALCRKVDGFGVYEPMDPARFPAGRESPAIVYCEVDNFASQLNDKQRWVTDLQQSATLFTETGMVVWDDKPTKVTDVSRNRRRDFFVVKMLRLPANLTIGRYLLKVTVIDKQSNRVAEASVPVQVVAQ